MDFLDHVHEHLRLRQVGDDGEVFLDLRDDRRADYLEQRRVGHSSEPLAGGLDGVLRLLFALRFRFVHIVRDLVHR